MTERRTEQDHRKVRGSMTVEAALVMAVVLFTAAALITEGFHVHGRTVGMFVLMESLERAQTGKQDEQVIKEGEDWGNGALMAFYRCSGRKIELQCSDETLIGMLSGDSSTDDGGTAVMKKFLPQRFLRMVRAIGV